MLILFFKVENYVGPKLRPNLAPFIGDISLILGTLLLFMMHWLYDIDMANSGVRNEI